jgi:hypothetical protein
MEIKMYRENEYSILPIGMTSLFSGKNADFGNVFDLWAMDSGTYLLVKQLKYDFKNHANKAMFRAVITSDTLENASKYYQVGQKFYLVHDQTFAKIGDGKWEVVGLYPNNHAGLLKMAQISGKSSIPFATFK